MGITLRGSGVCSFSAIFNNISVISWCQFYRGRNMLSDDYHHHIELYPMRPVIG